LLLCWRTEEQSAFEQASSNIGQTEFFSAFVVNFHHQQFYSASVVG